MREPVAPDYETDCNPADTLVSHTDEGRREHEINIDGISEEI